jgi:hypothetical protein
VQDENGKIDLNFAPEELLQSLFAAAGLSADDSKAITRAIAARRTVTFSHVADQITAGSAVTAEFPFRAIEATEAVGSGRTQAFATWADVTGVAMAA